MLKFTRIVLLWINATHLHPSRSRVLSPFITYMVTVGRGNMTIRVAINTGGGDAPGLNAVIRAATLAAINRGWEVYGIRDGYDGILHADAYPEGGIIPLTRQSVRGITHLGGTIIGTTNRGNPLAYPVLTEDGEWVEIDRSDEIVDAL